MVPLTAPQKLKMTIMAKSKGLSIMDGDAIDKMWKVDAEEYGNWRDSEYEVRGGDFVTGLDADYCRGYESQAVGMKMFDGSFVGWSYFHGGGNHSDPDSIPWIEDAYDLDYKEETQVVKVWSKKGE